MGKIEADNSSPAIVSDHAFTPRDPERSYWGPCGYIIEDPSNHRPCGLYLAAHALSDVPNEPTAKRADPETPEEVRTEEPVPTNGSGPMVTPDGTNYL